MNAAPNRTVWIEVEILVVTEGDNGAVLIQERPDVWIPKSQIVDFEPVAHKDEIDLLEPHDVTKLEVNEWIVLAKGIDDLVTEA